MKLFRGMFHVQSVLFTLLTLALLGSSIWMVYRVRVDAAGLNESSTYFETSENAIFQSGADNPPVDTNAPDSGGARGSVDSTNNSNTTSSTNTSNNGGTNGTRGGGVAESKTGSRGDPITGAGGGAPVAGSVDPGTVQAPSGINTSFLSLNTGLPLIYNESLAVALAIFFVLLMVGGVQYLASAGGEGVEKAKKLLLAAVVGFVLVFGAWAIFWFVNSLIRGG